MYGPDSKLRFLGLIIFLLMLTACSETSAQLRASPEEQGTFEVNRSYSAVLTDYYANAQKCFSPSVGTNAGGYFLPQENETVPGKFATVEIISEGTLSTIVLLSTDIEAKGGATKVTFYTDYWMDPKHKMPAELRQWADGTWTGCKPSWMGTIN